MANEYITAAALLGSITSVRLAEFTAASGSTASTTVLDVVREEQSRYIDSFIAVQVAVPVTDAPTIAILSPWCRILCTWQLYERARLTPPETLVKSFDKAHSWLMKVATREITLPSSATTPTVDTPAFGSSFGGEPSVFTSPDPADLDSEIEQGFV